MVITSVPQGLGGGSGFQPVSRTRGIRSSLAERIAVRAAYRHLFGFGDVRNPSVLVHRIEAVGGQTIHLLGRLSDAGASYTGRSNHLAEFVAVEEADTRGLPAGPAHASLAFPWLAAWTETPREPMPEAEPALSAHDPDDRDMGGRRPPCRLWGDVTGDPGWAGELAKSFIDGRRALLWTHDGVDVIGLFAEAARLLPVDARWQVTFNTCEIEPFPVYWRGVRADLPVMGPRPGNGDLVLDLAGLRKAAIRAPDHPLTRIARGLVSVQASPSGGAAIPHDVRPNVATEAVTIPVIAMPAESDNAFHDRIRAIREERRRRSGYRDATDVPSSARGACRSQRLLVATLAVAAVIPMLGLATLVYYRATRTRPVTSLDSASLTSKKRLLPRHTSPVSAARSDVSPTSAHPDGTGEVAATSARNSAQHDGRTPRPLPSDQTVVGSPREQTEQEAAEREKRAQADLAKAQRKAIDDMVAEASKDMQPKGWSVPAVTKLVGTSDSNALDIAELKPENLVRFDEKHIVDPRITLASPYAAADTLLSITKVDSQWEMRGRRRTSSDLADGKDVTVARLSPKDGWLRLDWVDVKKPTDEFVQQLRNYIMIVSSRDPTGLESSRRVAIRFGRPMGRSEVVTVTLKDFNSWGDHKTKPLLAETTLASIVERIKPLRCDQLEGSVAINHSLLTTPVRLLRRETAMQVCLIESGSATLKVPIDVDEEGVTFVSVLPSIAADCRYLPARCELRVSPVYLGEQDGLSQGRGPSGDAAFGKGPSRLLQGYSEATAGFRERMSSSWVEIEKDWRKWEKQWTNKWGHISFGSPHPDNKNALYTPADHEKNKTTYNTKRSEYEQARDREKELYKKRCECLRDAVEDVASREAKEYMRRALYDPLQIRLTSLVAVAKDGEGNEYPIELIVEPKD